MGQDAGGDIRHVPYELMVVFERGAGPAPPVLTVLTGPVQGHGAVVQGADLLPERAQTLLVRSLVHHQHLLHLSQRVQQVVSGRTVLWTGHGGQNITACLDP